MFWIIAAAMILVALLVVARVFLRGQQASAVGNTNVVTLAIYEKRLMELERDRKSGVLTEQQAAAEKLELEKALLEEINSGISATDETAPATPEAPREWLTALLIMLFVPAIAIFIYYRLGSPQLISGDNTAAASVAEHGNINIEDMVAKLAEKMQQNPDDQQGWRMLVRSYMTLGRYPEAVKAAEHLYKLTGDEPDVLLEYADALAMASNSTMAGKPEELVKKALAIDPDNVTGLWLAGMAQSEQGNFKSAVDYWQRALPRISNESDKTTLTNLINAARKQLGEDVTEAAPQVPASTGAVSTPAAAAAAGGGAKINVKVSLKPQFNGQVPGDTTLFITAQETAGPPMPIAVVRRQVGDLPLEIILDDSKAMIPTRKLSSFSKVKIGARISRSGNAIPQSGDLTAEPVVVNTGQQETVSLVIDREVK